MRESVRDALRRSSETFIHVVWPVIGEACGGGWLAPVELSHLQRREDDDWEDLDASSGIDHWQRMPSGRRGWATRVQSAEQRIGRHGRPLDTFTIRVDIGGGDTEIHKRIQAIRANELYPQVTAQAYVRYRVGVPTVLVSVGVIDTRALFDVVEPWWRQHRGIGLKVHRDGMWLDVNRQDRHVFLVVPWQRVPLIARWSSEDPPDLATPLSLWGMS